MAEMTPNFLFNSLGGDEAPTAMPGILLHFALAFLFSWVVLRLSRNRVPPIFSAILGTSVAFASGFLWRYIAWGFWAAWDDFIIAPYKDLQTLGSRGESIGCLLVFSVAPFCMAYLLCRLSRKRGLSRTS